MLPNSFIQIAIYFFVLLLLVKPLGLYMAKVYEGGHTFLDRPLKPVERFLYRLLGINPQDEMDWKTYAIALLTFSAVSFLAVYLLQRIQGYLPFNPQKFTATSPDLSFNTAVSYATNTNWQAYSGETTLSYLTQMVGLTVQNFVSAAAGMAVAIAFIRSLIRRQTTDLGNFWVDITRGTLYILLPLAIIVAVIIASQGVVQTLSSYQQAMLTQPVTYQQPKLDASGNPVIDSNGYPVMETITQTVQTLAVGPAASQVAIKQLGTNGGGFFNTNSTHPFENPTPLSNFIEMLSILLIPASLTYTFGRMVGSTRQGWAILAAMLILLWVPLGIGFAAEQAGNPDLTKLGADQVASSTNPGGNMEGKEVRFGTVNSILWAADTTAASNGSVNSMLDSFTPLGGLVPLWMMMLGEVSFGGVGSGLYGMFVFVIVAVFVAGLMVGRSPEYLGKKIEAYEMKMASLLILIMPILVLVLTAIAISTDVGKASIFNPGPHGFSEVLYAFTSQGNNNGSAFAGINANNPFYNTMGGIAMLIGRFFLVVPTLALAGSLVKKKKTPESAGTLPTHTPLFIIWLIAVVILVGALNFFPALALGPIVEHLMLW
jgi:K+-transporting ATPase ATPase A chain